MGKYVSAMIAAAARVTYGRQDNYIMFAIVIITSAMATIYQLYWDFVKDWGFLNPNSTNTWLRDDLVLKNKTIYYISIVSFIYLFFSKYYKMKFHSIKDKKKMLKRELDLTIWVFYFISCETINIHPLLLGIDIWARLEWPNCGDEIVGGPKLEDYQSLINILSDFISSNMRLFTHILMLKTGHMGVIRVTR